MTGDPTLDLETAQEACTKHDRGPYRASCLKNTTSLVLFKDTLYISQIKHMVAATTD